MVTTIQKWGNSQGIRIPKAFLVSLELKENDTVELSQREDSIVIKKAQPHKTLEERFEEFYGCPFEEIQRVKIEETDWGKPEGTEEW